MMSRESLEERMKRISQSRKDVEIEATEDSVDYMGKKVSKEDLQEMLDDLEHDERAFALTRIRLVQVLEDLTKYAQEHQAKLEEDGDLFLLDAEQQEKKANTKSIFNEYLELLDEDAEGGGGESYLEDGVPFWVNNTYLKQLHDKKRVVNWFKEHK